MVYGDFNGFTRKNQSIFRPGRIFFCVIPENLFQKFSGNFILSVDKGRFGIYNPHKHTKQIGFKEEEK